jgi:predicted enzyme related to lactoylglutathione lyase
MAKVLGIGGIFFKTDNPGRLFGWYEKHLAFPGGFGHMRLFDWRNKDAPDKEGTTVWCLFPRDSPKFGSGPQNFMVNYIVDDLDGLIAQLQAAGVEVDPKREDCEYGRFGWATDADGNRIELWQPPA